MIYLVTPTVFLERHRRFSSANDKKSQGEVMVYKEGDVITLYFHDIDKVYTTEVLDTGLDDLKIYLMNFMHKIPIMQKPTMPIDQQYVYVENKVLS